MSEQTYEGKEIKVAFAQETTFGTAVVDAGTYVELPTEVMEIDFDITGREIPGSHGTKNDTHGNLITSTDGSMPKFTLNMPFSVYHSDILLYAWFQEIVEGATTPYGETLVPHDTQPIFSNNAGKFLTFVKAYPVAGTSQKFTSCISSGFKLGIDRDSNDRMLMLESSMVSKETSDDTSTAFADATFERGLKGPGGASASGNDFGFKYFTDISAAHLELDGTASPTADAICLKGFSIECSHDIEGLCPGSSTYGDFGISNREMKIEITMLKDSIAEEALAAVKSNTSATFTVRWGAAGGATAEGDVQIVATFKIDADGITFPEDGIIGAVIKGTISMEDDQLTEPLTINIANAVDRAY